MVLPFDQTMDPSKIEETPPLSSPESLRSTSSLLSIPPSNYLTVPNNKRSRTVSFLPAPTTFEEDTEFVHPSPPGDLSHRTIPLIREPSRSTTPIAGEHPQSPQEQFPRCREPTYMSVYSTSSAESEHSTYSNPPARAYRVPSFQNMSTRRISAV